MPRFKFKYRTWVTIVAIIGLIGGAGFGALRTWEAELFGGEEPAAQTQAAGARAAAGGGQFAAGSQARRRAPEGKQRSKAPAAKPGRARVRRLPAARRPGQDRVAALVVPALAVRPGAAAPLGRSSP